MRSESGQATVEWAGLVLLVALSLGALLSLATREPIRVALLRHGASATRQLVFVARRTGTAPIFLSAETSSNHPGDLVTVKIRP
jgi:hypothetical protein